MNPKQFISKWIEGMKNLTPCQQLHAKMIGHIGASFGMTLAITVLAIRGVWYFTVFLFFILFLQIVEAIGASQRWKQASSLEDTIEQQQQNLKKALEEL